MPGGKTLTITTPEGISFSMPLAGPISRFLAWCIDCACVVLLGTAVGVLVSLLSIVSGDVAQALGVIGYFVLSIGYRIFLEWKWRGRTLGKRLLRLRVIDVQGMPLQLNQVIIRNLLRAVDSLPLFYVVGGVACLLSARSQRLGDLAANSAVIRQPRAREPDLRQVLPGKFNSLRDYPHLCARLRHRATPQEAGLALRALLRRETLDPEARIELFAGLATHFRALVQFPAETTEGVTDEQYLRNIVDVLCRGSEAREDRPDGPDGIVA
ncbi:MAG: RDD family protein [Acidobacteriota bacterium]